jgi:hypothetical protein
MGFTYGGARGQARFTELDSSSGNITVDLSAEQIYNISLAYERFKTDIYESLLVVGRLAPYIRAIVEGASWDASTGWFDSTEFELLVDSAITQSPRDGIIDLIELVSAVGRDNFSQIGWDMLSYITDKINSNPDLGAFSEELSNWSVRFHGNFINRFFPS